MRRKKEKSKRLRALVPVLRVPVVPGVIGLRAGEPQQIPIRTAFWFSVLFPLKASVYFLHPDFLENDWRKKKDLVAAAAAK